MPPGIGWGAITPLERELMRKGRCGDKCAEAGWETSWLVKAGCGLTRLRFEMWWCRGCRVGGSRVVRWKMRASERRNEKETDVYKKKMLTVHTSRATLLLGKYMLHSQKYAYNREVVCGGKRHQPTHYILLVFELLALQRCPAVVRKVCMAEHGCYAEKCRRLRYPAWIPAVGVDGLANL